MIALLVNVSVIIVQFTRPIYSITIYFRLLSAVFGSKTLSLMFIR